MTRTVSSYTSKDSALTKPQLEALRDRWLRISNLAYDRWMASDDPTDPDTIRHGLIFRMAGHHFHHYDQLVKGHTDNTAR